MPPSHPHLNPLSSPSGWADLNRLRWPSADANGATEPVDIGVESLGDPLGYPMVFLHSIGSCRGEAHFFHRAASRAGIRLIAIDRPGIGGSGFRQLADRHALTEWYVDCVNRLQLADFSLLAAVDAGGFAIDLANRLPARIGFVVTLGGALTTYERQGKSSGNPIWHWCLETVLPRLVGPLARLRDAVGPISERDFLNHLSDVLCYSDRKLLDDPQISALFQRCYAAATRQGGRGLAQDTALSLQAPVSFWGDLSIPLCICRGLADDRKFASSAEQGVQTLPGVETVNYPSHGRLFYLRHQDEIFQKIVRLKRSCIIQAA